MSFEVKAVNGINGLFSKVVFGKGTVVIKVEGKEIPTPTRTSVQLAPNIHIDVSEPLMFVNHDCSGNIVLNGDKFVALKNIEVGDEILFDYNVSEYEMAEPFKCRRCSQWVKGQKFKENFPCFPLMT